MASSFVHPVALKQLSVERISGILNEEIDVWIPSNHRRSYLPRVFRTIERQFDRTIDIRVVGSRDYQSFDKPNHILFPLQHDPSTMGLAYSLCCRMSKGMPSRYILIVEDDVLDLNPGCLIGLINTMESRDDIGMVSPLGRYHSLHFRCDKFKQCDLPKAAFSTGALLIKKKALRDSGNFNPYLFGRIELELSIRMAIKGWRWVYSPTANIRHERLCVGGVMSSLEFDTRLAGLPFKERLKRIIGRDIRSAWSPGGHHYVKVDSSFRIYPQWKTIEKCSKDPKRADRIVGIYGHSYSGL